MSQLLMEFGFGEYEHVETTMSVIWNLQDHVVNGHSLKFDSTILKL